MLGKCRILVDYSTCNIVLVWENALTSFTHHQECMKPDDISSFAGHGGTCLPHQLEGGTVWRVWGQSGPHSMRTDFKSRKEEKEEGEGQRRRKTLKMEKWFRVTHIRLSISLFVVHPTSFSPCCIHSPGVMLEFSHQTRCIGVKERRVCRALAASLDLNRFLLRMASHGHHTHL